MRQYPAAQNKHCSDGCSQLKPSRVFVSYSWDSQQHRAWVKDLATRLRVDGVDVTLDQWHTVPGTQLPQFMETAIRENDFVAIICTERYKIKCDVRSGGVGYEGDVMTAEVLSHGNHHKFIPILRGKEWTECAPSWLTGKYYVDLRGNPYAEDAYAELLTTLLNARPPPPDIGEPVQPRRPAADRLFDLSTDADDLGRFYRDGWEKKTE